MFFIFDKSVVAAINPTVAMALHAIFGILGLLGLLHKAGLQKYVKVET